jgi:hypothetical protein
MFALAVPATGASLAACGSGSGTATIGTSEVMISRGPHPSAHFS